MESIVTDFLTRLLQGTLFKQFRSIIMGKIDTSTLLDPVGMVSEECAGDVSAIQGKKKKCEQRKGSRQYDWQTNPGTYICQRV